MLDEQYEKMFIQVEVFCEQLLLNKNVLQLLVCLNLYLEKFDQVIEVYQVYVKVYLEDVEILFILFVLLMDNKCYDEVELLVDKLLIKSVGNLFLNQYKVVIEVRVGEFVSVLKYVEMVIQGG